MSEFRRNGSSSFPPEVHVSYITAFDVREDRRRKIPSSKTFITFGKQSFHHLARRRGTSAPDQDQGFNSRSQPGGLRSLAAVEPNEPALPLRFFCSMLVSVSFA